MICKVIDAKGRQAYVADNVCLIRFMSNYYVYFGISHAVVVRLSSGEHLEVFSDTKGWVVYHWPEFKRDILTKCQYYSYTESTPNLVRNTVNRRQRNILGQPSLVRKAKKYLKENGYYEEAL